ncbi:MAG: septal ring lytic transglycosylase RlpA family protein [Thermodesulfobacteriota bacterium]
MASASAASRSASSAKAPPPAPARYVVQAGDNLTAIAKKLGYDDPMVLARANKLRNPDCLQIGQVLTLPESGAVPPRPAPTTLAQPAAKPAAVKATANKRTTVQAQAATAAAVSHAPRQGRLVVASWYGKQHHGKTMANGQPFNMYADTVAHKKLPLGTRLTVTNPKNGASVDVRVTDRGPYIPGRNIDLSYGVARKLGVVEAGVARVYMEGG